jgi:hypothetical protein
MASEREILESAQEMIERYGADALRQINSRIEELENHGETDAVAVWRKIRDMVAMLLNNGSGTPGQ